MFLSVNCRFIYIKCQIPIDILRFAETSPLCRTVVLGGVADNLE